MTNTDVRQRADRPRHASGPVFDLSAAKLLRPVVRPGSICRASLIERLARGDPGPIVSVVAPAGYGKTTLLSQWAERGGQAFAWVSVDAKDNDSKILLTYVAEALDAVEPVGTPLDRPREPQCRRGRALVRRRVRGRTGAATWLRSRRWP